MELGEFFKMQDVLDERIKKEKGLEGRGLLGMKLLALQVELSEMINELPELFKFWSNKKNDYEKALEEYCDCLHFILSIGNDLEMNNLKIDKWRVESSIASYHQQSQSSRIRYFFWSLREDVTHLEGEIEDGDFEDWYEERKDSCEELYDNVVHEFLRLGDSLGFTWEQVKQSYYDKNKVNHERQENGY